MYYSSIGILAAIVLVIINRDVFFFSDEKDSIPTRVPYKRFLLSVLGYYITDILWGTLYSLKWTAAVYVDTVIYYFMMALSVYFWTQYVVVYLEDDTKYGMILLNTGKVFLAASLIVLVINPFYPIMFWFDANGTYQPGVVRYALFTSQIVLFLLNSMYSLRVYRKTAYPRRIRYRTIGLFGVAMILTVVIQTMYPLLPMYSIGYLIGTCLLHTYVIEDEKDEYRRELEEALHREQQQKKELFSARKQAYTDPLTGIRNRLGYLDLEEEIDGKIRERKMGEFAVAVFDLNDLKTVNDAQGHEKGDQYIIDSCRTICSFFDHSPVFRIGGDEFAAVINGNDYGNRKRILAEFNHLMEENNRTGKASVAVGMADFDSEKDRKMEEVFDRADASMYERKKEMKQRRKLLESRTGEMAAVRCIQR